MDGDFVASGLQKFTDGGCDDAFSQGRSHASGHEDEFRFSHDDERFGGYSESGRWKLTGQVKLRAKVSVRTAFAFSTANLDKIREVLHMRTKYPFVSHLAALLLPRSETGKTRRHHGATAPQSFRSCRVLRAFACTFLYVNKRGKQKNSANYTQTLHSALYRADSPRVTKCIVCGANYTQTIHKLYTNYTQTLH